MCVGNTEGGSLKDHIPIMKYNLTLSLSQHRYLCFDQEVLTGCGAVIF